jgi:hypothetical protein
VFRCVPQQSAPVFVYSQEAIYVLLKLALEGFKIACHFLLRSKISDQSVDILA